MEADQKFITREMVRARMMFFAAHDSQGATLSLRMWWSMASFLRTPTFFVEWFISYDFTTPHRRRDF